MSWKWLLKIFVFTETAILFSSGVNCLAGDEAGAARAIVKTDSLPIYAKSSLESKAVASLALGKAIEVKVEMLGAGTDGPWCGIALAEGNGIAGFVQCIHLERGSGQEQDWQILGNSISQAVAKTTKVIIKGNSVLVPVEVRNGWNKETVLLVLDTGAWRTSIHSEVASRLQINMRKTAEGRSRVADGSFVPIRSAKIDHLGVGPHVWDDMEITVRDYKGPKADHDGLLGMDVLRGLRYRIDFEKQEIVW